MTSPRVPYYTADAITDTPFRGNPAAACLETDVRAGASQHPAGSLDHIPRLHERPRHGTDRS